MRFDAVADSRSIDLSSNQPRFFEHLQMLRDSGLREVEPIDDFPTDAPVVAAEKPEDFDAGRMPERLGQACQFIIGRVALDRT